MKNYLKKTKLKYEKRSNSDIKEGEEEDSVECKKVNKKISFILKGNDLKGVYR